MSVASTRVLGPIARQTSGLPTAPMITTDGTPRLAARWLVPESQPMNRVACWISPGSSARPVLPARFRTSSWGSAAASLRHASTSPGPPMSTMNSPCNAASVRPTVASRASGQRRIGLPAPGARIRYGSGGRDSTNSRPDEPSCRVRGRASEHRADGRGQQTQPHSRVGRTSRSEFHGDMLHIGQRDVEQLATLFGRCGKPGSGVGIHPGKQRPRIGVVAQIDGEFEPAQIELGKALV